MNLIQKLFRQLTRPTILFRHIDRHSFPAMPISPVSLRARLHAAANELKSHNISYNLGALYTRPSSLSIHSYNKLLPFNPNHLGYWADNEPQFDTQQFEYEIVHKMIDLYGASERAFEGYTTTGATESNIYLAWIAKKLLKQKNKKGKLCLISTDLTHYSIRKAADVCDLPHDKTPLDQKYWNMHPEGLSKTIEKQYKRGVRGFIIPLTHGYTITGTNDEEYKIEHILKSAAATHKDINFFVWIDAALNGLILPFSRKTYTPLSSSFIQAYTVDFHKFGLAPYPSGIVLCRKLLRPYIESSVDYLKTKDNTLLGSRTGLSSVSMWAIIHSLGRQGFIKRVKKQQEICQSFLRQLNFINPNIEVILDSDSLSCGVIFSTQKRGKLPGWIEQKYWLHPTAGSYTFFPRTRRRCVIYKFYFLPHVTQDVIDEFIVDIKKYMNL